RTEHYGTGWTRGFRRNGLLWLRVVRIRARARFRAGGKRIAGDRDALTTLEGSQSAGSCFYVHGEREQGGAGPAAFWRVRIVADSGSQYSQGGFVEADGCGRSTAYAR